MRALLVLALFAGCERTSALYCEKNPDKCTSTTIDAPIVSSGCTTDDACAALNPQLPYCIDMTACGACRTSADCMEPTGVCDMTSHACRGCEANAECPSQVCIDMTSTCAPMAEVAYVGGTGPSTTCTLAAPCATLELALALDPRPHYIKLVDDVTEPGPVTFDGTMPIEVLGNGKTIHITTTGLEVVGTAVLTISNVEITPLSPDTNISDDCVFLHSGTPTLHISHARIHGCGGDSIDLDSGSATIDTSDIHDSAYGVEILGGSATIQHSTIHHNAYVGININAPSAPPSSVDATVVAFNGSDTSGTYPGIDVYSTVAVTNTIIARNGSTSSTVGGVRITSGTSSTFEFVTISDNITGLVPAKGMSCSVPASIKNSIITGNAPSTSVGCTPTYTLLDGVATAPNRMGDPAFFPGITDPTDAHFYHLQSASAAIGGALPDPNVPKDIDGDSRDSNHPDMGADEHN